ncbi:MAG: TIGR01212 family radical SAM protein [Oscillospiraceae bacterium]|nr:TIGR01212 family radical SAM protein [Oscillospiraceae bacterium]
MKMNPFKYSDDNKRYHTLNYYNKHKYGFKVYKAVIEAGFTCPNIDGTKSTGGCIFCDGGSGYFTNPNLSIENQIKSELKRIKDKVPDAKAIAYFQANTNTYAPVEKLREIYEIPLEFKDICGISIGTRADCLEDDVIEYLKELNQRTNLTVELGMQSVHNSTIEYINRGYSHEEFIEGYNKLKKNNIRVCIHIINGLPFETPEMMLETAYETGKLNPDAVKIQMLHIITGTKLYDVYMKSHFKILSKDEYVNITVSQLEIIPPETVVERITGDGDKSKLIAPYWSKNKIAVLGEIDKEFFRRNTFQGKFFRNA